MIHHQNLSSREKVLAAIAGVLLVGFFFVGYARAADGGASILAQSTSTATTGPISQGAPPEPPPAPQTSPAPQEQSQQDRSNQQNHIKNQQSQVKNLRREIDEIKRDVKTGVDTSVAEKNFSDFSACIDKLNGLIGQSAFWDSNRDCDDFSRNVNDELQDKLRPVRDCANNKRNIDDRKREQKNIERQVKDILRNDKTTDVSALNKIIADISAAFTKADALTSATCTRDTNDSLNDISQDLNGFFQDFYSFSNELNEKSNTSRRMTDATKDFEKNIKRQCEKEYGREMKNLEKELAKALKIGPLSQEAQENYDKAKQAYTDMCVTQLGAMQQALAVSDADAFDDARNEYHTLNQDFYSTLNDARNLFNQRQQLKDVTREMTQREKELKNMTREYEKAVKRAGGAQDSYLSELLKKYESVLSEAKAAANTDPQSWWDGYQQDLNDLQNEFWQSQQKVQSAGDVNRWIKDLEREIKGRERDLKNLKREADGETYQKLERILAEAKQILEKGRGLIATDPEEARDLLQHMDELRMQWDETTRNVYEGKRVIFELDEVRRRATHGIQEINKMLRRGELSGVEAEVCLNFINEVVQKLTEMQREPGRNMDDISEEILAKAMHVCPALDRIGEPPEPDRNYYENFMRDNLGGAIDKNIAETVAQNVSQDIISKVIERLLNDPSIVQNLVKVAGEKYKTSATGALEAASNFYDEGAQKDLLEKKAQILELTNQLEQVKAQVQIASDKLRELQSIQDELAGYNFYGKAGDSIRSEIESFIAKAQSKGLSKEEVRAGIEQLEKKKDAAIEESKRAKFDAQIIPFLDTDDNVWYTKYVAPLAKLGIVRGKGDGKSFDPSAQVTVAEVLTMAFRVSGDKPVGGESALCDGKFRSHWANPFIRWAEGKGLSVVKRCNDLNRPALRWEVAQILLETALDGQVPASNEQCFSDVKATDAVVNAAVCRAQKEGVLTGKDGRANAYVNIIRAEAATMVKQAAEKMFGFEFDQDREEDIKKEDQRGSSGDREDEDEDDGEDE